jgi:hypothetical protein
MRSTSRSSEGVSLVVVLLLLVAVSLGILSCTGKDASQASQGGQAGDQGGGKTRTYYVAADSVDWDFAPKGISEISGKPFNDDENVFVEQGEHRIGDTYRKALYREYTDESFSELKERPQEKNTLARWVRS